MEFVFFLLMLMGIMYFLYISFFKEILQKYGFFDYLRGRRAAKNIPEETYYEQVAAELRQGYRHEGLWLKAREQAGGNMSAAESFYIKLRIAAMKHNVSDRIAKNSTAIIACTQCKTNLRIPVGKLLVVHCPKCAHEIFVDSHWKISVKEFYDVSDLLIGRIGRLGYIFSFLFLAFIFADLFGSEGKGFHLILATVASLAVSLARIRDIGISSWNLVYCFIPGLNVLFAIYLAIKSGTPGRNQYGMP
ncbi:MAG: DUF805 domain-containing protein [Zoogloeaceae bacterium]|jgi:DNA-directed RNA polymerase subunit RPC12/RpoP|nr:DUF805 domain-containing protein [Zoogloeaceae bacterium]